MLLKNIFLLLALSVSFAATAATDLSKYFNLDLLGSNLKYVESRLGTAMYSRDITENLVENTYPIDGCKILVGFEEDKVQYLGTNTISKKCSIRINEIINNGYDTNFQNKENQNIKFGDIYSSLGANYYIDCFSCGAYKADPTLIAHYEGGRAHRNHLEITVSASTNTNNNYDRFFEIEDFFKKKYTESWLYDSFNCPINNEVKSIELTHKYLKDVEVESFFIGYKTLERYEIDQNCI
mgnify:FL=1